MDAQVAERSTPGGGSGLGPPHVPEPPRAAPVDRVGREGVRLADDAPFAGAALADRIEARLAASYRLAALVLGDRDEAEDATHEAILSAWSRIGGLRDPAAFDAWFDRILVNVCRDRLRHGRVLPLVDLEAADDAPTPDEFAGVRRRDEIGRAFGRLNPDQKLAVVLRYWGDRSIDEIAAATGTRAGTVKSRLHYALLAMRDALDEDPPAAADRRAAR